MNEREVKFLNVDPDELVPKIEALGAHRTYSGEVHALYFDRSDKGLSKKRTSLRLRMKGIVELTLKDRKRQEGDVKVCEETTVLLRPEDWRSMQTILEALGAEHVRSETKHRTSYGLLYRGDEVHFDMDELGDGIPTLLEIEALKDESIWHFAEALGLQREDAVAWSSSEVRRYYASLKGTEKRRKSKAKKK